MLCLKCGQREQHSDNLCSECLLEGLMMVDVPLVILSNYCPTCNKVLRNRSWSETKWDISESALTAARDQLKVHPDVSSAKIELGITSQDIRVFKMDLKVSGTFKGMFIERTYQTEVRLTPYQCPYCSKKSGSYFEATLQLRGLDMLTEEERTDLLQKVRDDVARLGLRDPNVFITKEGKAKGGHDFLMGHGGSTRIFAQRIHDTYGGDQKVSNTLAGRKEGRELYRMTYLVRLPGFLVGDYLVNDKGPFKVLKSGKKVTLRSLRTRQESYVTIQEAMEMRAFRKNEVEFDLVLLTQTEREVQVMHPRTYATVDLVKYEGMEIEGSVKGALIDGELYLV
ncbi:MAG: NMD3-related protein [Candidatus Thermoplasmatota archaeon]|jgi:nonsense-mediated mRNA decay protein 3|nr:NMD3-related protein [Candidatus Thermoplasmatota archaeon]